MSRVCDIEVVEIPNMYGQGRHGWRVGCELWSSDLQGTDYEVDRYLGFLRLMNWMDHGWYELWSV